MSFPQFGEIINENESSSEFPEFGEIISSNDDFQPQPGIKQEIRRHTLRSGSRALESLAGLPGDILSIPKKLASSAFSKLTGVPEEKVEAFTKGIGPPGSQELKKLTSSIFGKTVKPQSQKEELSDEIVSDAASLLLPIKGKIPFLRALGTAAFANLSGEGAKQLGLGEGGKSAAKLGSFFLSGLVGKGTVKKFWNQKYAEAEKAIPKEAKLDAFKLERSLDKLEDTLKLGLETPSQKAVLKPLNELRGKISGGRLGVEEAVAAKRSLNEIREQLFDEVKGRAARRGAKTKLNDISKYLDESLEKYGQKNPEFYVPYKEANEAFSGFQQSKKVGDYIKRAIPYAKLGQIGTLAFEALFRPSLLPATLGGYGALKTGELLARMFKNPTLRKYYFGLLKSAASENKAAVLKNIRGIDKEIQNNPEEWGDVILGSDNNSQ